MITKEELSKYPARCCICGKTLTDSLDLTRESPSIDHVFPKSCGVQQYVYQTLCKRCNGLKGALAPTASLYKIIEAIEVAENNCGRKLCRSISVRQYTKDGVVYNINLYNKSVLEVAVPQMVMSIVCNTQWDDKIDTLIHVLGKNLVGPVEQTKYSEMK